MCAYFIIFLIFIIGHGQGATLYLINYFFKLLGNVTSSEANSWKITKINQFSSLIAIHQALKQRRISISTISLEFEQTLQSYGLPYFPIVEK